MNLIMKGRGIPKELHAGPVGYNDRADPLRDKAKKMMQGDMGQVSKPYSPESASSPGNTKLTRGYKAGGHVKTGHKIATNMHLPREIDGHMPKKTPQNRMKKAGGVMQGDCGPGPSRRHEHEAAVQGQKGPRLKKGGDCYATGGHVMPHKGIGGILKKVGKGVYKASKPVLREVAKKGINYGSKALGTAATTAATAIGGRAAGEVAGNLTSKGVKSLGKYATKKAGLKHGGMPHKGIGGILKSAAKSGAKMAAKKGVEYASKKVSEMSHGGHMPHKGIGGILKSAGKSALKTAAKEGTKQLAHKVATMRHGGNALERHVKKKLMGEI